MGFFLDLRIYPKVATLGFMFSAVPVLWLILFFTRQQIFQIRPLAAFI
jgi:hypothetical protein